MPYCNVTLKRIQCTHSGQKWPKNRPDQDDDKSIFIFIVTWRWRKSLIVLPTIEAFNETKSKLNWLRLLSIKLLKKKGTLQSYMRWQNSKYILAVLNASSEVMQNAKKVGNETFLEFFKHSVLFYSSYFFALTCMYLDAK